MNIKVYLTVHFLSPFTYTHKLTQSLYILIRTSGLNWGSEQMKTLQTHKRSLVLFRGICFWCLSRWAVPSHKGAVMGIYFGWSCRKKKNFKKADPIILNHPHPCVMTMVWSGLLKPLRDLVLQTYFADVFVHPWRCGRLPFPLSVLLQECWLFTAHGSQTTILDERQSIHCNSSCLYNRCGSTDVYVLYSRVHFYYLQIKTVWKKSLAFFYHSIITLLGSSWQQRQFYILGWFCYILPYLTFIFIVFCWQYGADHILASLKVCKSL